MATQKTREELRRQALENLAASRQEISAETGRIKQELDPRVVVRRISRRHKAAVAATALGLAAAVSLLVYRHVRHLHSHDRDKRRSVREPADSLGSSMIKLLVGTMAPVLLKSVVVNPLLESLAGPRPVPSDNPASRVNLQ